MTYRRRIALASFVSIAVLLTAPATGQPLAEFTCREVIGVDWPRTLVTYPLQWPAGRGRPDALRLLDSDGREIPFQLSRVTQHPDGSLASARLSFFAALPKSASFAFKLVAGMSALPVKPLLAASQDGFLTLDNGIVALRLPEEGDHQPPVPLSFGTGERDRGSIPGPMQGIRLIDKRWTGTSYLTAQDAAATPKVVRFSSRVNERGPLFVEAVVRYEFDNGGTYQFTARMLADDPAIRIDEQFDLKQLGPGMLYRLTTEFGGEGWSPDYVMHYGAGGRLPQRAAALDEAMHRLGIDTTSSQQGNFGSREIVYGPNETPLLNVSCWNPWTSATHYAGFVDTRQINELDGEQQTVPFVGVVPMHAGNWRGAHGASETTTIFTRGPGTVGIHWPLLVEPYPFSLMDTAEYDPDLPRTFGRRQWALVGGPVQYHPQLAALRGREGFVNLDDYKDWVLDWDDDDTITYPRLLLNRQEVDKLKPALSKHPGGKVLEQYLYFNDTAQRRKELIDVLAAGGPAGQARNMLLGGDGAPWQSHYRQSQWVSWAMDMDELFSSPDVQPEQRRQLRAQTAALCYLLGEPDFNPRGSMIHIGNPNMPINRFMALPVAAALIPDHPMAGQWLDVSTEYLKHKLVRNTAPLGVWAELISYFQASTPALLMGGAALRNSGRLDDATAILLTLPSKFTVDMVTPKDPRFGHRFMPNWGHEGAFIHTHWLPAAGIIRSMDPELARTLAWCWDQLGRPMEDNQEHSGWMKRAIAHADLLNDLPADHVPPLMASRWMPGFGAVLRAHVGDPDETYFAYRQGYMTSHSDANQGDFVLYSKGAPLSTLNLFQYGVHNTGPFNSLWQSFGWHNRPRFGSRSNTDNFSILSQVQAHAFSPSLDYLRGRGESGPNFWTRQILFLKGKRAAGPNYFVFRETVQDESGATDRLQPKWWTLRTPGGKDRVNPSPTGIDYTSEFGTELNVRFLQPAAVEVKTEDATQRGPVYNRALLDWIAQGRPVAQRTGDTSAQLDDTMSVSSFGPIAPGENILVVLTPQKSGEADPKFESLADGAARITTGESEDYVFADRKPMNFRGGEVAFQGLAGAVRVYPDEVHLILSQGPGEVSFQNVTLRSSIPAHRVIPRGDVQRRQVIDLPAPKTNIQFVLDESAGSIEQIQPGVKRQGLTSGFAYSFDSSEPLDFQRDEVHFVGRRGGLVVDRQQKTVRMILFDGETVKYQKLFVTRAHGPYDVTFHPDRVVGKTSGQGRFLFLTTPHGLTELPQLIIDGVPSAPGTWGPPMLIMPILPGEHDFEIRALGQVKIWRNWQAW